MGLNLNLVEVIWNDALQKFVQVKVKRTLGRFPDAKIGLVKLMTDFDLRDIMINEEFEEQITLEYFKVDKWVDAMIALEKIKNQPYFKWFRYLVANGSRENKPFAEWVEEMLKTIRYIIKKLRKKEYYALTFG